MDRDPVARTNARIYRVVGSIPFGRVATYGQVARLAGLDRQARRVGHALRSLDAGSSVPWHRVVNRDGGISRRGSAGGERVQYLRLSEEGVRFSRSGRISLEACQWRPGA